MIIEIYLWLSPQSYQSCYETWFFKFLILPALLESGNFSKRIFNLCGKFTRDPRTMGKVRRYKKKLAKAATGTGENDETGEQPGNVDYLELAEELLSIKKDDDKISVCSVMKSLKSNSGESLKLKKDSKRYLKHAILLKSMLFLFFLIKAQPIS